MSKHKWRESFKSSFGNHIDPEKDEELRETKTEIDGKVQKILRILKEEDGNDRKESPLADLIEDFRNHYQSLYARYDHLTNELRKKAHGKHGKDSSSSSSDSSDSDDSPRKKGKNNGKVEIENNTAVIKQELEMALLEVGDLKRKLAATMDEKEALYLEHQSALSKSQEARRIMMDLVTEEEKCNKEKSELLTENSCLNVERESSRKLQAELNQRLEDMNKERESLIAGKEAAFVSIEGERRKVEELRTMNSDLHHEKDNLHLDLEAANGLLSTLKEKLESAENEIIKLSQMQKIAEEEKSSLSSKLSQLEEAMKKGLIEKEDELYILQKKYENQETETSAHMMALTADISSLKQELDSLGAQKSEADIIVQKKSVEISEFLVQIENLKEELSSKTVDGERVLEENESLAVQLKDLQLELETLHRQKSELEDRISSKDTEKNQLSEEKWGLENKISEFEKALVEQGDDVIAIEKKLEDVQNDASSQIDALREQVNSLQKDLELLQSEKSQLELQIARGKQESTENIAQAELQHTELVNKIMEQERKLKEQCDAFIKLSEENKQLELQFQNCEESLKSSEKKMHDMTDQFHKDIDAKDQEINQLEENLEDLKTELEMKVDDISRLVDNMRTTEVKQRLTTQKLRITEQLLGENEESQLKRVVKLQEEQKLLEEKIAMLSGIIAAYKEAQAKLVTEISEKVNDTLIGIDTFSVKFEEDYGHLESRIFEIMNELKVTKNWIAGNNAEKAQLKDEISGLLQQLKNGKEQELQLAVKITELETVLQKDEDERKHLLQTVKQREENMGELQKLVGERDEKMGELERKMNEKDNGIISLGEEKREAIRQLCIWIDYHHNRYDNLRDVILQTRGGRRHIAT